MGLADGDFEKGEADGTADALMILETIAKAMRSKQTPPKGAKANYRHNSVAVERQGKAHLKPGQPRLKETNPHPQCN